MNGFLKRIIKEYIPLLGNFQGDDIALVMSIIGTVLISLSFTLIGILCITLINKYIAQDGYKERRIVTKLTGLFLISCGLSRFLDLISIWYNYALINAYIKIFTGTIATFVIFYIPKVIKSIRNSSKLDEVKKTLTETKQKIDSLKNLTDKIIEK